MRYISQNLAFLVNEGSDRFTVVKWEIRRELTKLNYIEPPGELLMRLSWSPSFSMSSAGGAIHEQ